MEENLDEKQENQQHREILSGGGWDSPRTDINRGLLLGAVALLIVAGIAFGYGYRQQIAAGHLTAQQTVAQTTIDQLQSQLNSVNTSLNSTKDELNGSIAKTHDELVVLQRRVERNYFEFDLTKSKQFQRFGPLTLSLRRTDAKHRNYDLSMVVDDNRLDKKRVNLFEPIWIHSETGGQPVQIVVNKIGKNEVHGYISAPK